MKTTSHKIVPLLRAFLIVLLASSSLLQAQLVNIPDPILREAIGSKLGKPADAITVADMESLTQLAVPLPSGSELIGSLEGLQTASNLESLSLYRSIQTDLDFSPLGNLTSLATLSLSGNQLSSLTLPSGLTGLSRLVLHGNQLERLDLPSDMKSLLSLALYAAVAPQFTLVEAPKNLEILDFPDAGLTHLNLPDGLSKLSYLDLRNNNLQTLEIPDSMVGLVDLHVTHNGLEELTMPEGLTNLRYFSHLAGNFLPEKVEVDSIVITQRTEEKTVLELTWTALPGAGHRIEISPDLKQWTEVHGSGPRWIVSEGCFESTILFATPTKQAVLSVEFPGEWKTGFVRIRQADSSYCNPADWF